MKLSKIIAIAAIAALGIGAASAQVVRKKADDKAKKTDKSTNVTERMQSFYNQRTVNDADMEWMRVIYRQLDLTQDQNMALYYPEEPNADGKSLFFIIMHLLADNQLAAYEYLDGREMFTDEYRIKVRDMLDRFHIIFTPQKGSNDKNPKFKIEDSDIPGNEVLSYYIVERWEFDRLTNHMNRRVDAICPVLHRSDDWGRSTVKFPMFWVKMSDLRPYLTQQYVFTNDDNNLARYNLDDYFVRHMYKGEIYKTKNLKNLSLAQMYPDADALKHAQDSIEARLNSFDKNLWVPSREELQAMAEARQAREDSIAAAADTTAVAAAAPAASKAKSSSVKRTTKRGASKSTASKSTAKATKPKAPKAAKPKATSSSAGKSVRRRK